MASTGISNVGGNAPSGLRASLSLDFEPTLAPIRLPRGPSSSQAPTSAANSSARTTESGARITYHYFPSAISASTKLGDGREPLQHLATDGPGVPPAKLHLDQDPPRIVPRTKSVYHVFDTSSESVAETQIQPQLQAHWISATRFVPATSPLDKGKAAGITLLLSHGAGFQKEVLEPMLETLVAQLHTHNVEVAEAWSVDMRGHGDSRTIVAGKMVGPWPIHPQDYARDMINLVTLYLPATPALGPMPMILYARHGAVQDLRAGKFISTRPSLVLIGHSLGGAACVAAGLHVPSLFARVVAVEPILFDHETYPLGELVPLDKFAIKKPIVLPNREAIKGFAKKHPVWATYTPEVLDKALNFAWEEVSLADGKKGFALKCSPWVEAVAYNDHATCRLAIPRAPYFSPDLPVLWISCEKPMLYSAKGYDGKAANQRKVALFPNASISFLPGTHNLPQEKTDAVASQICDFLVRGSSPANKL